MVGEHIAVGNPREGIAYISGVWHGGRVGALAW